MSQETDERVRRASRRYDETYAAFQAARAELIDAMAERRREPDERGRPTAYERVAKLTSLSTVHVRRMLVTGDGGAASVHSDDAAADT